MGRCLGLSSVPDVRKLGYLPSFDGMRAIAILLVLATHAGVLPGGTLGVDLFFVLSGFLITTLLLEEHETAGTLSVQAFYARRAFRLLPALWLLLGVYAIHALLQHGRLGSPGHIGGAALIGFGYVANFFAAAWSPHQAHYLMHLWSLAQEEQYYLLWAPLLLFVLVRGQIRTILCGIAVLVVLVTTERWILLLSGAASTRISFAPDTNLDSLLIGSAAGFLWTRTTLQVRGRTAIAAAVVAAAAVFAMPHFTSGDRADLLTAVSPIFPAACAAVLIFLAADCGRTFASRTLGIGPLRYLGVMSYGVYLWHFPLMHLLGVLRGLGLTAVVAPVSYRYVEAPLRRYGRRLAARPQSGPVGTLATEPASS